MIQTTLFPGRYVQGTGASGRLEEELTRHGSSALLIADPFAAEHLVPDLALERKERVGFTVETFGGECSAPEIERLVGVVREQPVHDWVESLLERTRE